jgi:hypothetical protein
LKLETVIKYEIQCASPPKFVLQYEHQRRRRWLCTMCKNYQTFSNLVIFFLNDLNLCHREISWLECFSNPVPFHVRELSQITFAFFCIFWPHTCTFYVVNYTFSDHLPTPKCKPFLNIVLIFFKKKFQTFFLLSARNGRGAIDR